MEQKQNVDLQEIAKFEKMAANWWDPSGDFKPLHQLNPFRLNYIDEKAGGLFEKKVLDVGCGGGILTESMASLGAKVTGIDMGEAPLTVAKLHAQANKKQIDYYKITAEEHSQSHQQAYDVVTCMEMLEHVPDPLSVVQACEKMVKPGGWVFFSTINRTIRSYLELIIGAEYLLKILPVGTHSHDKFITPSELMTMIDQTSLNCLHATGVSYNPLTGNFSLNKNLHANYMLTCHKEA